MLAGRLYGGLSPWRECPRTYTIVVLTPLNEHSSVGYANGTTRARRVLSPPSVAVFQEVPELLREIRPEERAEVSRLRVQVTVVDRGPWLPPVPRNRARSHLGLLVLEGLVLRRVTLGERKGAELLGAGDLLQPWRRQMPYDTLEAEPGWEGLEPARLAILDRRFAARISPWPEIAAALVARVVDRARMLAFQHVASHIPGLGGRLLALMWAFADRWGRVTREGVVIPLPLTHATLAELVGASRPSVSTAVARLAREGVLTRTPGGWLLDRSAPHDRGASPCNNGEANGSANGRLADASATLVAGVTAILLTNLVLLGRAFAPLSRLTSLMRRVEPLEPGERIPVYGDDEEVVELTRAFNEMLDRLEAERWESARRSLDAQEGERRRVAQELHDEVGQALTAIVLQLDRMARKAEPALREELAEARESARASLGDVRRIAQRLRPEVLEDLGLANALQALCDRVGEHGGIRGP